MKKLLSLLTAALLLAPQVSFAAISYDVTNQPQGFLDVSITPTQTSTIKISALLRNGVTVVPSTTSGGILRLRTPTNSFVEDISFTSITVNQTTKISTLVGVTRNLCWNLVSLYVSCGDGRQWSKGTIVELNISAQLLNAKANIDRVNTFKANQNFGSGALITGSGYYLGVSRLTTTERDALSSVPNGALIYNKSTGVLNQRIGGAWSAVGTDTTSNATTTTSGKVEAGIVADHFLRTSAGDSGAPVVVVTEHLASSGGTSLAANRIPIIGSSGLIDPTFIATTAFGNGGSGAYALTATGTLRNAIVNQFTTLSVSTGVTLRFKTANSGAIMKNTGNVSLYGKVNLSGSGGTPGAGGAAMAVGTSGGEGRSFMFSIKTGGGGFGTGVFGDGGGAGGGGSQSFIGTDGGKGAGSSKGASGSSVSAQLGFLANASLGVVNGGGGGGGGGSAVQTGGKGGKGGGALVWYIGGNLTLGSTSWIKADGLAGSEGSTTAAGGGGGGGGGAILIIVAGTIVNGGVQLSAVGGAGASGGSSTGNGGTGGVGNILIYSLSTGVILSF